MVEDKGVAGNTRIYTKRKSNVNNVISMKKREGTPMTNEVMSLKRTVVSYNVDNVNTSSHVAHPSLFSPPKLYGNWQVLSNE